MKVEIVVFIYMYVCICVVAYDFLFIYQSKHNEHTLPDRVNRLKVLLESQVGMIKKNKAICPRLQKKIIRRLTHLSYLTAFRLLLDEDKETVVKWAYYSTTDLLYLTKKYYRSSDEKKAFFAYLISKLELKESASADSNIISSITLQLILYMKEQSVYIRENAFKAIISFGDYKGVVWAVEQMNENTSFQNERLIGDDLLLFHGDLDLLSQTLFGDFDTYTPTMQVAFINYMRFVSAGSVNQEIYNAPFLTLLESEKTHKEVRLALLRYFRRYKYPPVYPLLLQFVSEKSEILWEYAAVAASTIAVYPEKETIPALVHALKSYSWYIRFNAAESLLDLNVDCEKLFEEEDSFAEEMLQFRMQIHEQKRKSRLMA